MVGAPQPDLLLFFIAAITLRQRRRLIDECRDQVMGADRCWLGSLIPVVEGWRFH